MPILYLIIILLFVDFGSLFWLAAEISFLVAVGWTIFSFILGKRLIRFLRTNSSILDLLQKEFVVNRRTINTIHSFFVFRIQLLLSGVMLIIPGLITDAIGLAIILVLCVIVALEKIRLKSNQHSNEDHKEGGGHTTVEDEYTNESKNDSTHDFHPDKPYWDDPPDDKK